MHNYAQGVIFRVVRIIARLFLREKNSNDFFWSFPHGSVIIMWRLVFSCDFFCKLYSKMAPIHFIASYFFLLRLGSLVHLQKGVSYSALVYFYTLKNFLHSSVKFVNVIWKSVTLFRHFEENAVKEYYLAIIEELLLVFYCLYNIVTIVSYSVCRSCDSDSQLLQ